MEKYVYMIKNYFYLRTCRRRFVLEHFDQIPKFFCCNKCDNCLKDNLVDVTEQVWQIHHSPGSGNNVPRKKKDLEFENIKQNLIAQKLIRYATKDKLILVNSLANWIKFVTKRDYALDNLPANLRVRIPIQYLYDSNLNEDEFDKCEKMMNSFDL